MTRVYVLIDPRTNEIRYVGKTSKSLGYRLGNHMKSYERNHRGNWISELRRLDLEPRIELVQEVPDDFWQEAERYWISYYRAIGCDLTNATDGGEGSSGGTHVVTVTMREAVANANRKRVHSIATRAKLSAASQRRTWTLEQRAAVSARQLGRPKSDAHREGMRRSHAETQRATRAARDTSGRFARATA